MVAGRSRAPVQTRIAEAAPIFAALGDETRLRIVLRLCDAGPQSIVRLTEAADVTRQAVTKHLRALSDAGLVRCERVGREAIWELETKRLEEVRRYLAQISQRWDGALARLKTLVETER